MFHWTYRPAEIWKSSESLRGPPGSYQAAVSVGHKLYCFRGYDGSSSHIRVYFLNTLALCWLELPPAAMTSGCRRGDGGGIPREVPAARLGHSAVSLEGVVYVWGGGLHDNRLYAFDTRAHVWLKTEVSGTVPQARSDHSACVSGKLMYVHGGHTKTWECTNDVYTLDTATMVWSFISTRGTTPPISSQHSATVIGTKMFIFGGWGSQSELGGLRAMFAFGDWPVREYNNIRVFDTETNHWLSITPSTRLLKGRCCEHAAFAYNGELYIFRHETFNDLWKFNTETFSWKKVKPKGKGQPKKVSGMGCCMVGDRVVLFYRDLYILDLSPSLKTFCKLAVVQYGLEQSALPHDIRWELAAMTSGGNWNQAGTGIRWELEAGGYDWLPKFAGVLRFKQNAANHEHIV